MADQRDGGIAWTDQTWNPTRGCRRVSTGCENCYAETVAGRFSAKGQPYEGLVTIGRSGKPRWNGKGAFVREHLDDPLRWRRPRRVFVNSMSDLFHDAFTNEQIAAVFGVMGAAHRHTFQLLTKRPKRAREWFAWVDTVAGAGWGTRAERLLLVRELARNAGVRDDLLPADPHHDGIDWPLPNVWLGVSVEDQETADERIPLLLDTPAAIRFVSYEPALGHVDFTAIGKTHETDPGFNALRCTPDDEGTLGNAVLDWIIVGGESGSGARAFDVAWARSTIEQCRLANVPVFVKQFGAVVMTRVDGHYAQMLLRDRKGGDVEEWPPELRVREFPKPA